MVRQQLRIEMNWHKNVGTVAINAETPCAIGFPLRVLKMDSWGSRFLQHSSFQESNLRAVGKRQILIDEE